VGISKDGSKIYGWLKKMVWNTQYDVNEHTIITLDTSGIYLCREREWAAMGWGSKETGVRVK
jgi:hypothetical protein